MVEVERRGWRRRPAEKEAKKALAAAVVLIKAAVAVV
jgi:hypothetical protein